MEHIVIVNDKFHHDEEEERYKLDEYDSCQAATDACMTIVDDFLRQGYREDIGFKELWEVYMMFGEDPLIAQTIFTIDSQLGHVLNNVVEN